MTFETYLVGGAVRDHLLGIESKDRDYVVVGSSPEELLALGFKQVGSHFPVFLHPVTGEEYALARREKKSGNGYGGFQVEFGTDVTLEEDLSRRDLTINAMAMTDDFQIIDPYGGLLDLEHNVLRHVSDAFAEDPLRVLRVARFVARYGFRVAPETFDLCKKLVESGELQHLTPERVWKEFSRMMEEEKFVYGYEFLAVTGARSGCDSLRMLMADTSDSRAFDAIDLRNYARQLTVTEKALLFTNISMHDISFVPNDLTASVRRLQFLHDLIGIENFDLGLVLRFVDQNRAALTTAEFREEILEFAELFVERDKALSVIKKVIEAASAVYALDFTTLLKDVPKDRIKEVVREHKMTAIEKAFA